MVSSQALKSSQKSCGRAALSGHRWEQLRLGANKSRRWRDTGEPGPDGVITPSLYFQHESVFLSK